VVLLLIRLLRSPQLFPDDLNVSAVTFSPFTTHCFVIASQYTLPFIQLSRLEGIGELVLAACEEQRQQGFCCYTIRYFLVFFGSYLTIYLLI
jgi:hypothetical protein